MDFMFLLDKNTEHRITYSNCVLRSHEYQRTHTHAWLLNSSPLDCFRSFHLGRTQSRWGARLSDFLCFGRLENARGTFSGARKLQRSHKQTQYCVHCVRAIPALWTYFRLLRKPTPTDARTVRAIFGWRADHCSVERMPKCWIPHLHINYRHRV